jgi:cell division protein FtsA
MVEERKEAIFALDIGTRSVVGLLVEPDEAGAFKVIGYEREEHAERSMLDGQIHDVVEVAKVITRVKQRLEAKLNVTLQRVAVAAAGRSLHTQRVESSQDISTTGQVTKNDIIALELSAVQQAQHALAQEHNANDFSQYYCVGYSVVNYFLDGEMIGNLIDQRGKEAKVDVIATFLPRVVVDSLMAALQRSGLEMQALTLEPIAAINVLVPSTMRRLNVALVDIGAGTSDIAITGEGTVSAYGMVPTAGDEITDALSQAYLLDFTVAEEMKRQLSEKDEVSFHDILGMEHTYSRQQVVEQIASEINHLASLIGDRIVELNGKAPQAVMLIGGGSLTPDLPARVASKLELPPARVAVRGTDAIQAFTDKASLSGPEFVTPLGIAVAAQKHPIKYLTVYLNEEPLRIFDLKEMSVGDVLLYAGIDIKRLHGRPGLAMTVHVNGKMKIIPGSHGKSPLLLVNGEAALLDSPVQSEDRITLQVGENGQPAAARPVELLESIDTLDITIHDTPYSLPPFIKINGETGEWETPLADRDQIEVRLPRTLAEALAAAELYHTEMEQRVVPFTVNGKGTSCSYSPYSFYINGREAKMEDRVNKNDAITYVKPGITLPSLQEVIPVEDRTELATTVTFNGQTIRMPSSELELFVDGKKAEWSEPVHTNATIVTRVHFRNDPVFSDVFRYVESSLHAPETGKTLITTINGAPAAFTDPIKTGDALEFRWE